jgi:hypothetical protein
MTGVIDILATKPVYDPKLFVAIRVNAPLSARAVGIKYRSSEADPLMLPPSDRLPPFSSH